MSSEVTTNDIFRAFIAKLKRVNGDSLPLTIEVNHDTDNLTIVTFQEIELCYMLTRRVNINGMHIVELFKCKNNTTTKRLWKISYDNLDDDSRRVDRLEINLDNFIKFLKAFHS